jgi:3-oxoacyl-[acyl-carrier-protein] synthase-3
MSVAAAKTALKHAGIKASQIKDLRIGVNTHLRFPSLAALVQNALGIPDVTAADVSAGCSGFIFAVEEIYNRMIADYALTGKVSYGLAIGVEALSLITDWNDRSTCVLFGDGAGAVVIGPVQTGEILATHTRVQGKYSDLLYLDEFLSVPLKDPAKMTFKRRKQTVYPFLHMNGPKVFVVAVRTMMADIKEVIAKYNRSGRGNLQLSDIQFVIPHQANRRIVSAVARGLRLPPDRVYSDGVVNYGNTSAASIPIGYVDVWDKYPGALMVDVAFGAGFASGAILRRMPRK